MSCQDTCVLSTTDSGTLNSQVADGCTFYIAEETHSACRASVYAQAADGFPITYQLALEGRPRHTDRLPALRGTVFCNPAGKVYVLLQTEDHTFLIKEVCHLRQLRLIINEIRVTLCSGAGTRELSKRA